MPRATTITSAPASDTKKAPKKAKKSDKSSSLNDSRFVAGYHTAYTTIYDAHEYATAIDQLKALGHDETAAVANLIAATSIASSATTRCRRPGTSALQGRSEPGQDLAVHYGLWQLEQGNREQAEYHLNKIASLAGTNSEDYTSLAAALQQPPGTGLVY